MILNQFVKSSLAMIQMLSSGSVMSQGSKEILVREGAEFSPAKHEHHHTSESISAKMLSDQSPHKAVLFSA
jgi:hypothetical protein